MRAFEGKKGEQRYDLFHLIVKVAFVVIGGGILFFAYNYFIEGGKAKDFEFISDKLENNRHLKILK